MSPEAFQGTAAHRLSSLIQRPPQTYLSGADFVAHIHRRELTMFPKLVTRRTFVTGMLCVGTGTVCRIIAGDNVVKPANAKPDRADSQSLGGTERYLTFVATDKPIYRGSETLYVRAFILHHATRQ